MSNRPAALNRSIWLPAATLLFLAAQAPSVAGKEVDLNHVSKATLIAHCVSVQGKYSEVENEYTCVNSKKGTAVSCNEKKCTGTTKDVVRPRHLREPKTVRKMPEIRRARERAEPRKDWPRLQSNGERKQPGRALQPLRRWPPHSWKQRDQD